MSADPSSGGRWDRQSGSILLFVLFLCLAVAIVAQSVCAVVLCAERSVVDESVGRRCLADRDQGLMTLRQMALAAWRPSPWSVVWDSTACPDATGPVEGTLRESEGDADWTLEAAVRQEPTVSAPAVSAWVERGRDGIDLPVAALVAGMVTAALGRSEPWLSVENVGGGEEAAAGTAVGYVVGAPKEPLLDDGCTLAEMRDPWRLDPGWKALESSSAIEAQAAARAEAPEDGSNGGDDGGGTPLVAVAPGPQVVLLGRDAGPGIRLSDGPRGTPEQPVLALMIGGAELDARDLGDLYGVVVIDEGSLLLDGTTVHGAVFVTGSVDFGDNGRVVFSRSVLRWATDRSLRRARLVPGTRWEGME